MFQFLFGVAFGAAGYWAWQSFGRDLLGMGGDQDSSYGGFSSGTTGSGSSGSTFGSGTSGSGSSFGSGSTSTPTSSTTSGSSS